MSDWRDRKKPEREEPRRDDHAPAPLDISDEVLEQSRKINDPKRHGVFF